jgi:hypothetical protein
LDEDDLRSLSLSLELPCRSDFLFLLSSRLLCSSFDEETDLLPLRLLPLPSFSSSRFRFLSSSATADVSLLPSWMALLAASDSLIEKCGFASEPSLLPPFSPPPPLAETNLNTTGSAAPLLCD